MNNEQFYTWLKANVFDLPSAELFIRAWVKNEGRLPGSDEPWQLSVRAMAGHLSNVLENKTEETGWPKTTFLYYDTKFGFHLASIAWTVL